MDYIAPNLGGTQHFQTFRQYFTKNCCRHDEEIFALSFTCMDLYSSGEAYRFVLLHIIRMSSRRRLLGTVLSIQSILSEPRCSQGSADMGRTR